MKMKNKCLILFLCVQLIGAQDLNLLFEQGREFQEKGDYAHAIEVFKKILFKKPASHSIALRIGDCFEKLSYPDHALKYYQKALEYSPTNTFAQKRITAIKEAKAVIPEVVIDDTITKEEDKEAREIDQSSSRLFIIRDEMLYTMQRTGEDLRRFSDIPFGQIADTLPGTGLLTVKTVDDENQKQQRDILFFEEKSGRLMPVAGTESDEFNPRFRPSSQSVFYLSRNQTSAPALFETILPESKKHSPHLSSFASIDEFVITADGHLMFLVGQQNATDPKKVWSYDFKGAVEKLSFGQGIDGGLKISPDQKQLSWIHDNGVGMRNLFVFQITKKISYPLTKPSMDEMQFTFTSASDSVLFSKTRPHPKDKWETALCEVDLASQEATTLSTSNFQYKEMLTDDSGLYLYYLSDYDNNWEIYRLQLNKLSLERMSITSSDEEQIGFWKFQGY